jgi:hypothetical protein
MYEDVQRSTEHDERISIGQAPYNVQAAQRNAVSHEHFEVHVSSNV